jgi:hypothetical protein
MLKGGRDVEVVACGERGPECDVEEDVIDSRAFVSAE